MKYESNMEIKSYERNRELRKTMMEECKEILECCYNMRQRLQRCRVPIIKYRSAGFIHWPKSAWIKVKWDLRTSYVTKKMTMM